MHTHDKFFFGTLLFLAGILLSSIGLKSTILKVFLAIAAILLVTFLTTKKKPFLTLAILTPLLLIGAVFYTNHHTNFLKNQNIPFGTKITFRGEVVNNPQHKKLQEFKLKLEKPYSGQILAKAPLYPKFQYGDKLEIKGSITKVAGSYGTYLMKEKISGTITYPQTTLLENAKPSIKRSLFALKSRITQAFKTTLPYQESSFLSGITLGSREDFSREFKNAMSLSGTTHLVALSGHNITILITTAMATLTYILSKRKAFLTTIFLIIAFVLMTGGEASIVRAAIMGTLAALAPHVGRIYAPRNSIALTGFIMTLENPNVLAHDIGFQLSFLALLGIIYLKPAIQKILRIQDKGFLAWKENFLITLSAQIMVAPILIATFGSFTLTSLIANIIILETIPVTMLLGFILAGLNFISYTASLIMGWFTLIPLKFEIAIIHLFSKITIPINPRLSLSIIATYYAAITLLINRTSRKPT